MTRLGKQIPAAGRGRASIEVTATEGVNFHFTENAEKSVYERLARFIP
jgi:hypothetical protein